MRIVFPTIALWLLTVAACGQQKKTEVFEKDWVMTPRTASSYVVGIVQPLLDKAMRDQSYPPGISQRIARIFTRIQNKEIIYLAEPFYSPLNKKMLAHVDYDVKQEKPILMVFVPAIKDLQAQKPYDQSENFELLVALTFAHEEVHLERAKYYPLKLRAGKYDPYIDVKEEAEAWGITIFEMIRPAIAQHRWVPDDWTHNSEELKKAGDNYDQSGWIAAFANYHRQ